MTRFHRTTIKTERARRLRMEATLAERKLWARLRGAQLAGYSFRRQHPIGPFIADFYCAPLKLVIELDGDQHAERRGYDAARTRFLESRSIGVMRFWNNELIENFDGVLESLHRELLRRRSLTSTTHAFAGGLALSG